MGLVLSEIAENNLALKAIFSLAGWSRQKQASPEAKIKICTNDRG